LRARVTSTRRNTRIINTRKRRRKRKIRRRKKDKKDKHGDRKEAKDDEHRKKDKKKKKDKDRERERGGVEAESPYLSKLVIKQGEGGGHTTTTTTPASSPPHNQRPLPKLKIKLGGTPAVQSSERSKKRDRSDSSAKLDIPAAKMARVMGTGNPQAEEEFLQHKLGTKKDKKSSR